MINDPRLWLSVAFIIFAALSVSYLWPALKKMLDNKAAQIAKELQSSIIARQQAEIMLSEAKKFRQESMAFCEKLIKEAAIEAETLLANARLAIEEEINQKINLATKRIEQEEERVIREIKKEIIKAAISSIEANILRLKKKEAGDILAGQAIHKVSKLIN